MAKARSFRLWRLEDHILFILLDRPVELDFEPLRTPSCHKAPLGVKGFDPRVSTKSSAQRLTLLLLYIYCQKADLRMLSSNQQPDQRKGWWLQCCSPSVARRPQALIHQGMPRFLVTGLDG